MAVVVGEGAGRRVGGGVARPIPCAGWGVGEGGGSVTIARPTPCAA